MNKPYENLLPDTPDVVKCRDFLKKNVQSVGGCKGYAYAIDVKDYVSSVIDGVCHASFRITGEKFRIAAGGVNPTHDQFVVTMRFLEWVFKESPWEIAFRTPFEVVWRDDLPVGIILSEETCSKFPSAFIKQIFILFRCIQEHHSQFQAWDSLVTYGMHPDDAFFLCRKVTLSAENQFANSNYDMIDGWHWPLTFKVNYGLPNDSFDWDAYYDHNPNFDSKTNGYGQQYNRFFMKNKKNDIPEFNLTLKNQVTKTRFSKVSVIDTAYIQEEFNKWKRMYKIRDANPRNIDTKVKINEENFDY